MKGDALDPRALIEESFKIEGITAGECRSIFLDWALGVGMDRDVKGDVEKLLVKHADQAQDHPMTQTLVEALAEAKPARRRGGRAAKLNN